MASTHLYQVLDLRANNALAIDSLRGARMKCSQCQAKNLKPSTWLALAVTVECAGQMLCGPDRTGLSLRCVARRLAWGGVLPRGGVLRGARAVAPLRSSVL